MKPKQLKYPFSWEERRPHFSDAVLYVPDYYDRHHEWPFPGWPALFGNDHPVVIEYCAGNGTWIAEKARQEPEKNWVAVEWEFERVRKIWSKIKNNALSNLIVISGEAVTFSREYIPAGSVHEAFVNFPDPWPKEKHAKHRLFQQPFTGQLSRILMPGGRVTVATDDPIYATQVRESMLANPLFQSRFPAPHFFTTEWPNYGTSFFDSLWRAKGKTIHYFQFESLL